MSYTIDTMHKLYLNLYFTIIFHCTERSMLLHNLYAYNISKVRLVSSLFTKKKLLKNKFQIFTENVWLQQWTRKNDVLTCRHVQQRWLYRALDKNVISNFFFIQSKPRRNLIGQGMGIIFVSMPRSVSIF